MRKGSHLGALLRSGKTVFSSRDVDLLWGGADTSKNRVKLHYFVERGELYRIRRGFYAKDREYNRLELATRIFTPAYVSFETVLVRAGLVFQYYKSITVATYLSREITCDGQPFRFRKVKDTVLTDPSGIEVSGEFSMATAERAFLDTLHLIGEYHFDNLSPLDWEKVFELVPLYGNQRLRRAVEALYRQSQQSK